MAGETDWELTLSASVCHISGPNSFKPGQILSVYGIFTQAHVTREKTHGQFLAKKYRVSYKSCSQLEMSAKAYRIFYYLVPMKADFMLDNADFIQYTIHLLTPLIRLAENPHILGKVLGIFECPHWGKSPLKC